MFAGERVVLKVVDVRQAVKSDPFGENLGLDFILAEQGRYLTTEFIDGRLGAGQRQALDRVDRLEMADVFQEKHDAFAGPVGVGVPTTRHTDLCPGGHCLGRSPRSLEAARSGPDREDHRQF